jgi:hypothetical protein
VRRPRGGRTARVLVALGLAALTACTTSGYTYVANDDLGTYFRVPEDFEVFAADEVMASVLGEMPDDEAEAILAREWAVAFDASDEPAVDRFITQITDPSEELAGYARVRTLGAEERLSYSLQSLRTELIPAQQFEVLGDRLELRDIAEISQDGGQGLKLTFALDMPAGTLVFDQVGLVDDRTSRVYLLAMGCSSDCYDANRDAIADISESWTIEER